MNRLSLNFSRGRPACKSLRTENPDILEAKHTKRGRGARALFYSNRSDFLCKHFAVATSLCVIRGAIAIGSVHKKLHAQLFVFSGAVSSHCQMSASVWFRAATHVRRHSATGSDLGTSHARHVVVFFVPIYNFHHARNLNNPS
jgi:hypothetical protein